MRKIGITALVAFLLTAAAAAQPRLNDEQGNLSYRDHEQLINPASLGGVESARIGAGVNKQWLGIEGAPMSEQLQIQMPLSTGGWGAWLYNESYGQQRNTQFAAAYAYKVKMTSGAALSLGLNLSLLSLHEKPVSGDNPNDEMFQNMAAKTLMGFNAGVGAYYFSEALYLGFSVPQLLANDLSADKAEPVLKSSLNFARMQYYLSGGYRLGGSSKWSLTPSALLGLSGKAAFGYEFMLTGVYNRVVELGAGIASHSYLKVAAGASITKNISLRYQFSRNLGNDYRYFGSSHYVSLWIKMSR